MRGFSVTLFAYAAALIYAVLGGLHGLYALRDFAGKPRYFRPTDGAMLEAMRATKTAIAPRGRDYWSGILGFHLSHSIGVLLFALLIVISELYQIGWLMPVLAANGALLTIIAWRCWFHIPMIGSLVGTVLIVLAWVF